jgi:hypothetical protein
MESLPDRIHDLVDSTVLDLLKSLPLSEKITKAETNHIRITVLGHLVSDLVATCDEITPQSINFEVKKHRKKR